MFIIFGLKSIIKQLLDLVYGFLHLKCIIKQLLDSVFVICKIINVSVRVISLAFGTADNSYLDVNNCTACSVRLSYFFGGGSKDIPAPLIISFWEGRPIIKSSQPDISIMTNRKTFENLFSILLVFSYNTMKDQWTELPKLSKERGYHGICGIGSNVYIAGGYSCVNSETLNSGT